MRSLSTVLAAFAVVVMLSAACYASGPVEADDDSYYNEVVRSETPVVLEFYATWCGACKRVAPEVDEMASGLGDRVKVVKMNVDKSPATSAKFKVRSIPMFFYMEDGNERGSFIGAGTKEQILKQLGVPEE